MSTLGYDANVGRTTAGEQEMKARVAEMQAVGGASWDGARDYTGLALVVAFAGGVRNLNLDIKDISQREEYLNRNYFIGNLTVGLGKRFSYKSRLAFGLDLGYDESVDDLARLDAFNNVMGVVVMIGLAITGMALKFSYARWAVAISSVHRAT